MDTNNIKPNRLALSSSPYLLQHANNPVDWYEWGNEAWQRAKTENKPVLVSIGYSACHWCHVMEHESFENADTAAVMNEFFISIKVDREERPDIDQIYMDAAQLMNGRGGWPLNVFCLPDGRPIYGGTYFPNRQWNQLLFQIHHLYKDNRAEAEDYAAKVSAGLQVLDAIDLSPQTAVMNLQHFIKVQDAMEAAFDFEWGGNNRVPKFPMPVNFELLRMMAGHNEFRKSREMMEITLDKMASGGIYDQLAGGFARYSTDREWLVPHFEKMLYDNAQLISLYSAASVLLKQAWPLRVAEQTALFCIKHLSNADGGFYSAFDADSEGVEGKYYTWQWPELQGILGKDTLRFAALTGCTEAGNWEHGQNILHIPGGQDSLSPEDLTFLEGCNKKLLEARVKRIPPGLDDKVILAWNGQMMIALCKLANVTGNQTYLNQARGLFDFVNSNMKINGSFVRSWRQGVKGPAAFLEDYAFWIMGLINMAGSGGGAGYLIEAGALLRQVFDEFYDEEKGTFYFTSNKGEALIARKTDVTDDVIPSSNAIMSQNLMWLGLIFGEPAWLQAYERLQGIIRPLMQKNPGWYSQWLQNEWLRYMGAWQIVVSGPNAAENAMKIRAKLPDYPVLEADYLESITLTAGKKGSTKNQIYVCEWQMCHQPFSDVDEALAFIDGRMGFLGNKWLS